VARAHERYPATQQLIVNPSDPKSLWVQGTYGLLRSQDSGQTWDWICEASVGYSDRIHNPTLTATLDGKIFVAAENGLFSSADHGCSWSADLENVDVKGLSVESDGRHVLALVQVPAVDHYDLVVYRSDLDSQHFAPLVSATFSDLVGEALAVAPSDDQRIYATGAVRCPGPLACAPGEGSAVLLRSRDGGVTWQRLAIPGATMTAPAFVAAVHPTNPEIVYVRVQGESKPEAMSPGTIESWLLYTEDAGETWKEIFRGPADIQGFLLGGGGSEVLLGLGDSHDAAGARPVDPSALGVYAANAPGFEFTRLMSGQVGCLTRTTTGVFVCGTHAGQQFELGFSSDNGLSASPVLDLGGVRGPLHCGPKAPECQQEWLSQCSLLGSCTATATPSVNNPPPRKDESSTPAGAGCSTKARPASAGAANETWLASVGTSLVAALTLRRRRDRK